MAPFTSNSGKGKNKHKPPKKRKNKVHLVFDETKRKEFLTGFHKRKLQRQKHAQENLDKELREERKRLKQEAKEAYKKLVVSNRPVPEVAHLVDPEEYEDDEVEVKVVELSSTELARQNNWIGPNVPKYESDGEDEEEDLSGAEEEEQVPGMELKAKPPQKKVKEEKETFNSAKDVKKLLKKQATKNVKKSKVFQKKHDVERRKQRKKSMQQKKERIKMRTKMSKKKGRGIAPKQ